MSPEITYGHDTGILGLRGLFLGSTVSRKWFLLPVAVTGFLLQHAIQALLGQPVNGS